MFTVFLSTQNGISAVFCELHCMIEVVLLYPVLDFAKNIFLCFHVRKDKSISVNFEIRPCMNKTFAWLNCLLGNGGHKRAWYQKQNDKKNNRKSELWNIKNKNKALKSEEFIGLEEIRNMACSKSVFKTTLDVQ